MVIVIDIYLAGFGPQDSLHDGEHVVGRPGEEEDKEDEGECLGRLPLLPLLLRGLLQFVLPGQGAGGDRGRRRGRGLHAPDVPGVKVRVKVIVIVKVTVTVRLGC